MNLRQKATEMAIREGIKMLQKDFDANAVKLIEPAKKKFADNALYIKTLDGLEKGLQKEGNMWKVLVEKIITETDAGVLEKIAEPALNAFVKSYEKRVAAMKKYDCNIPWAILIDPTAACNLKCTGCWAAEYGKTSQLSYDDLSKIITEGKELGTYIYLFTGGEPTMRKKDIIRLCDENPDCLFFVFTNGTLVDDAFADELRRVGNMLLTFSIEGSEETTDARRGSGTYNAVISAMGRLKSRGVPFGASLCYTKYNADVIGSDEYADFLIDLGVRFAWYFTFMPVGAGATNELMATASQREMMYKQIRKWRFKDGEQKPFFTIDFFNDGEYVGGCIAGGKQYFHINSNGDCEPCVFAHYSNSNIKDPDTHLVDVLRSPIFMAYRQRQAFSDNMLRPCPVLDNPGAIKRIVEVSGAKSTDVACPETVDALVTKTVDVAKLWKITADKMADEYGFIKKRVRSVDIYKDCESVHLHDYNEFVNE